MSSFICPVCKNELLIHDKVLSCNNNHCFDISKHGYVNLLQSQKQSSKRHGDDKLMVCARKDFLDGGYYNTLLKKVLNVVDKYAKDNIRILDAGCGECWYTANIMAHLKKKNITASVCGIDIARDALIIGKRRSNELELAVASIFNIPAADSSCDIVFNFFAPVAGDEYKRILKCDGILIRAIPLQFHLWELKCSIYDTPYENDDIDLSLDGFSLIERHEIRDVIRLPSNQDIQNLFMMTPYYYKTSKADQIKIDKLKTLDTKIEFGILVYKKD